MGSNAKEQNIWRATRRSDEECRVQLRGQEDGGRDDNSAKQARRLRPTKERVRQRSPKERGAEAGNPNEFGTRNVLDLVCLSRCVMPNP